MTTKQVQEFCKRRGVYFNGKKEWLNSCVGYGYSVFLPTGKLLQAQTLDGLYKMIQERIDYGIKD